MRRAVLEELQEVVRGRGRWLRAMKVLAVLFGIAFVVLTIAVVSLGIASVLAVMVVMAVLVVLLGLCAEVQGKVYPSKALSRALETADDMSCVGPLLEGFDAGGEMAAVCRLGLLRTLPILQASDRVWLSGDQRRSLYRALRRATTCPTTSEYDWVVDEKLAKAALAAIEQVGDGEAVEYVEAVANRLSARGGKQIAQMAQELLPLLRSRANAEAAARTLLRPADAAADTHLLRPAPGASTDSSTLLRAEAGDAPKG